MSFGKHHANPSRNIKKIKEKCSAAFRVIMRFQENHLRSYES